MNNNRGLSSFGLLSLPVPRPTLFPIYERNQPWWRQILDPGSEFVLKWNQIFLFMCFIAVFLDPLYFYVPRIGDSHTCMGMDGSLGPTIVVLRCIVDIFAFLHIFMKFRTAYVAPNSRVFGKGELVMDTRKIAIRYLKRDFWFDLAAALPLPQACVWFIIPADPSPTAVHANHTISLVIILQYVPRLFVIYPLNQRIVKNTGVVARTAWAGAAYNLIVYLLVSHVLGAMWYLLAIEREHACWRKECLAEQIGQQQQICKPMFLDCRYNRGTKGYNDWLMITPLFNNCNVHTGQFQYGMFGPAFEDDAVSVTFFDKFFYCLWWGLKNLCSYGQNLKASTSVLETLFGSFICLIGLLVFALLIGNVQSYMQSRTARLEEWRVKRRDTEEWMRHRQLPPDLQDRVRRFVQYKWLATRGVDEESILHSLPLDLRRQIQRHLCLALVRRVPFFSQMDDQLLDAICERLVSSLSTKDSYIVREGDPVNEMLFIIRGLLESSTTNGGRLGFFNSITLKPGDFCGEELLTWALIPNPDLNFPSSTRTVKAVSEVEAFALRADDLKFVAQQFKRLHSKKLQHAFRYYSHQWRTWGACFMQAAWRRYKRKKLAEELAKHEGLYMQDQDKFADESEGADYVSESSAADGSGQLLTATILASKFAANTRRAGIQKVPVVEPADSSLKMPKLFKPDEPDFSTDEEDR